MWQIWYHLKPDDRSETAEAAKTAEAKIDQATN
jgi:hypothetical protein